jgi:lipopolysaccharide transport system ATP-binding protein
VSELLVVDNVGKSYKSYASEWQRLREWVLPFSGKSHDVHWVLRNVSFRVHRGESIGLIGVNGAGKSTLLKIITGTVKAGEGQVLKHCSVGAILELGMGFHPDFTGNQNAMMAMQLRGMTHQEALDSLPSVQEFSELGDYLEQPVRTYSSVIQMRLAFSVATAKRPDLLIVDEALSVGDAYFQHKSFDRIREFKSHGTSLFLVSHDRNAILSLCDRAIMLDGGALIKDDAPEAVLDYYNAHIAHKEGQQIKIKTLEDGSAQTSSGTGEACISDMSLVDENGVQIDQVRIGQQVTFKVRCQIVDDVDALVIGFLIKDRYGHPIYGINTYRVGRQLKNLKAGQMIEASFRFSMNLGKGNYAVSVSLSETDSHVSRNFEWRDRAFVFHVLNVDKEDFVGTSWLDAHVECERVSGQEA